MKKFSLILKLILLSSLLPHIFFPDLALALEPKKLEDVNVDNLVRETQNSDSQDAITLVWWIPQEFWAISVSKDPSMSVAEREEFLKILEPYFMLGVVQGKVSSFGSTTFYDLETVKNQLTFYFEDSNGQRKILEPAQTISSDVELLQNIIRPMIEQMMGNFGQNFHFLTFEDKNSQGDRHISPYEEGTITVQLSSDSSQEDINLTIDLPLDALFVSRICPNGKEAHVSWKYCPWDGTKLED